MYAQNTEKDCCLVREVLIQRSDAHAGPLGNARCSESLRAFLLPAACSRRMAGQNFRLRRYQALTACLTRRTPARPSLANTGTAEAACSRPGCARPKGEPP